MVACSVQIERLTACVFRGWHRYTAKEGECAFAKVLSFPTCGQVTNYTKLHSAHGLFEFGRQFI